MGFEKTDSTFSVGPNKNGGATLVFVTDSGGTTTASMSMYDAELLAELLLLVIRKNEAV